ncbi:polysaccharide pyruvyl transferase family protein [Oleomonas cavernae]|uniref:Polysaccharide pyruvyl transferase family protein n=1 Tax=Oleomonas cavernae TaxID=2320859 RepID=A0A418WD06_9PROT|nr:polysaccharide pyruvyl transferase family protein [Oleomonas cavernae]RJF87849.1 polysaccharide pyruvyl transferase family protein [Oleomonas cavernae]
MSLPDRIPYWTRGEPRTNFGDYLTELLYDGLFRGRTDWIDGEIHLIGSVISDLYVEAARAAGHRRIVYWGCGLRHPHDLAPANRKAAKFCGVRGLLTRAVLGLPRTTPIGDPGLLLPRFYRPAPAPDFAGKALCIRHVGTSMSDAALLKQTGADVVLSPWISPDRAACHRLIDAIAAADFVLTASLHGAVVAHAYGVPFAYLNDRKIDVPFKWADFSSSIGFECDFVSTVKEGRKHHARNARQRPALLTLDALVAAAPLKPA